MSDQFLRTILEDVFDRAYDPDAGVMRLTALTEVLLGILEEADESDAPQVAYFRSDVRRSMAEVHGYAYDVEDDVIQLFYILDATEDVNLLDAIEARHTSKDHLDRAFKRLDTFAVYAETVDASGIEESQPVRELIDLIKSARRDELSVELFVITTGIVADRALAVVADQTPKRHVWDLERLQRACGSRRDGTITVDLAGEFGCTLPCLVLPQNTEGVQVLLTCMPGSLLARVYNRYRSGLLERNVRSFLQFTGKVNKGIRNTLLLEPHRFLSFNNGLSATAGAVDLDVGPDGTGRLRTLRDFQIVNGGQTTATIASCQRRDGADLAGVMVAMKLTVVPENMLAALVPQISRYANTQNRIEDADFSANAPWHIEIERLSRGTWLAATNAAPRGTRWFYERSRGQYADEVNACGTPARKRVFRTENPPSQKFTKTDLAKYLLSWEQFPAIVSRGAQKCFVFFMTRLSAASERTPVLDDFKQIVVLGILFRFTERLHTEMGFQGYRANAVTYAIARLSHEMGIRLDADSIWSRQTVTESIASALKLILPAVRDVIEHPPAGQRNVTEWCKKDACWHAVLARTIDTEIGSEVVGGELELRDATIDAASGQGIDLAARIPADVWFATEKWTKDNDALQPWQRRLAYSLGRVASNKKQPTPKQAKQGLLLLYEAISLGFISDGITSALMRDLNAWRAGNRVNRS